MLEVDSEGNKSKAVRTMLKFLTHKLRSHSINEDPNQEKTDDDHDSGTESDDEFQDDIDSNQQNSPVKSPSNTSGVNDSLLPSETDFSASIFSFVRASSEEISDDISNKSKISSSVAITIASTPTIPITTTTICQSREIELLLLNDNNDQHSSEEELEVINTPKIVATPGCRPATAPEKRKWSQVNCGNVTQSYFNRSHQALSSSALLLSQQQQQQQQQQEEEEQRQQGKQTTHSPYRLNGSFGIVATCSAPVSRAEKEAPGSGSSDEEIQGLLSCNNENVDAHSQPVKFHTSPPINAHKPGRSLSPPPKLFHASTRELRPSPRPRSRPRHHSHLYHYHHHYYHHHHHHHHQYYHHHHHHHNHHKIDTDIDSLGACSPRKRHRPPHRQPRPCLDFEKMQQLKARALTAWRHSNEHGNELSVFCW